MALQPAHLACLGVLFLLLGLASSELVLPLDGKEWTLQNENGTLSLKTVIPAYPLEVLRSQGVIGDPLYRYGELESRWVAMESWSFSTSISAQEVDVLLEQQQVLLQLAGVDTYADVVVNGRRALQTISFHRRFTVPIKAYLIAGEVNTLSITIKSAFKTSLENKDSYPYHIPTLYNTGSIGAYNFARKPAFDFGWDWGPALAASGIHGGVKLVAFSQPTLAGAFVAQTPTPSAFKLVITAQFYVPPVDTKGTLTVSLPELKLSQQQELAFSGSGLNASELVVVKVESEFTIDKASVQLWWPAGGNYGPHKLYDVELLYTPDSGGCGDTNGATLLELVDGSSSASSASSSSSSKEAVQQQQQQQHEGRPSRMAAAAAAMDGPAAPSSSEGQAADAAAELAFADVDAQLQQASSAKQEAGTRRPAQQRALLAASQAPGDLPSSFAPQASAAGGGGMDAAVADVAGAWTASEDVSAAALSSSAESDPAPAEPGTSGQGFVATAAVLKDLLTVIGTKIKESQGAAAPEGAGAADADGTNDGADGSGKVDTPAPSPATAGGAALPASVQCSGLKKRVGFRTIELVTQPLPQAVQELFGGKRGFEFVTPKQRINGILARDGAGQWANNADGEWSHFAGDDVEVDGAVPESFYFRVNGLPIFMKGANVIPMSVLPSNTTTDLIEATLQAAVDSNQNMLRVWGGGLYHPEAFYDFCDENGLLIWQDAMFGGSHYPRTPEWLANYADEIAQQAQRLSWHPSVALWCGNNEIDLSYEWSNSTVQRSNRNMFVVDYQAVFIDTVRKQIKQINPGTIFVDSSPTKGAIIDTPEMYIKRWGFIGDPRYGTIHSYNYMSDCEDFRSYPLGKFVSEFGWQSYPLPETYAAAMDPERDWGVGNPMNEFRNRRTDVTPQFLQQYAKHFALPKDWNPADPEERMSRFRSYLWLGNMQHMRCYETALNFWRRLRSNAKSLTMGVMYWQLNDIWAGASWSSIDVAGRWKPVHYAVKRAYAPLAVQAVMDGAEVQLFVVSDLTDATPATLTLRLVSLDDGPNSCADAARHGAGPQDKKAAAGVKGGADANAAGRDASVVGSFDYTVPGLFATRVWKMPAADLLKLRAGCSARSCYLSVTAEAKGWEPSESQLWFAQFKDLALPDPAITVDDVKLLSPIEVSLRVRAQRPAPLVMLSAGADRVGHFTDNGFNLDPCQPRIVTFISHDKPFSKADMRDASALFSAESLFDHSSWSDGTAESKKKVPAAAAPATGAGAPAGNSAGASKNGPAQ